MEPGDRYAGHGVMKRQPRFRIETIRAPTLTAAASRLWTPRVAESGKL